MKILFTLLLSLYLSTAFTVSSLAATGDDPGLKMKVFTLDYADTEDIIPALSQVKSSQGKITSYPAGNKIIVYDTAASISRIASLISQLDLPKRQVTINVLVAETSGPGLRTFGLASGEVIDPEKRSHVVDLLRRDTYSSIRSDMNLRVMSGSEASLMVASKEIYPGNVIHDEHYTLVTPTMTRSAGDMLYVLPEVNNNGTVTVSISPSVSEFTGRDSTHERTIFTKVIVNNGDTLVLGGLDSTYSKNVATDIPFTGLSVKHTKNTPVSTIMLLTVYLDN